jgi:hypothetical protein
MKIRNFLNIYVFIAVLVTFLMDIIYPVFPEFRYFKYFGFPIFFILIHRYIKLKNKPKFNTNTLAFIYLIIHSLLFFWLMPSQGILELLFIFIGISIWFFNWRARINFVTLAYLSYFSFIIFYASTGNFDFSVSAFFKSQTSDIEGGISFVFGFLALYFWEIKKKKHFIVNVILLILTLKRVVLFALIIVILLSILPKRLSAIVQKRWLIIGVNLFLIFLIQLFSFGVFDDFIREFTNLSPGEFSSGRQYLFLKLFEDFGSDVSSLFLQGLGQGSVPVLLGDFMGQLFLLHNDILKITIEHGYLFFIIFLFVFYRSKNAKIFRLCVFLNIIYFTDNALIYQYCYALFFGIMNNYKFDHFLEKTSYYLKEKKGGIELFSKF